MDALKRVGGICLQEIFSGVGGQHDIGLKLAREVRWDGHLDDGPDEGAGGRERPVEVEWQDLDEVLNHAT